MNEGEKQKVVADNSNSNNENQGIGLNTSPEPGNRDSADRDAILNETEEISAADQRKEPEIIPLVVEDTQRQDRCHRKAGGIQTSQSSPDNSTNSYTISGEVSKTLDIGKEVGFQLDGFDDVLRKEIEDERSVKNEK
ncbi:hypothetical protein L1887_11538 [Cichorium endivia]|nr:hypothetical protein L1887_11538 [Cichorium endivia]